MRRSSHVLGARIMRRTAYATERKKLPIRPETCRDRAEVSMRKAIRNLAITGCLALPMALFGANRPGHGRGSKDAQRVVKLASEIQEAVAKDESLSTAGRKVKVFVEQGVIILKGIVMSDAESQAIQGKAESFVIQATPERQIERSLSVEIDNNLVVARL
jgi:hypothetical protein